MTYERRTESVLVRGRIKEGVRPSDQTPPTAPIHTSDCFEASLLLVLSRGGEELFKNWTNRDWIWLLGVLISVIILLIAGFYNSDKVELNFSIISSAVSIALALVAISIALSQSKDNQELTSTLKETMAVMHEKLNNVGEKVNNVDEKVNQLDSDIFFKEVENREHKKR